MFPLHMNQGILEDSKSELTLEFRSELTIRTQIRESFCKVVLLDTSGPLNPCTQCKYLLPIEHQVSENSSKHTLDTHKAQLLTEKH